MCDDHDQTGRDVDWEKLEREAADGDEVEILQNLRQLHHISRFHRLLQSGADPIATLGAASQIGHEAGSPSASRATWRHLHLRHLLGAGAHAEVYLAWDPRLEREVALKLFRTPGDEIDGAPGRTLRTPGHVLREGRLMARVRHPNVVNVHGAEVDGERVGIWMDYIRGRTLSAILADQGTLGAREATLIGLDLCGALAAVHGRGLVHQDVKAQNVMREEGGRTVLMDFGVGVDLEAADIALQAAGTPFYMAPEALLRGEVSVASDIYSLGVLLFHLVCGQFPVPATDMATLLAAHEQGRRQYLRDLRPDLPRTFIDVVERALAAEPATRQQSMGELESELHASLGAKPVGGTRPTRSRSAWTGLAIVLAAVILGGALYWTGRSREPQAITHTPTIGDTTHASIPPPLEADDVAAEQTAAAPVEAEAPRSIVHEQRPATLPALPDSLTFDLRVAPVAGDDATQFTGTIVRLLAADDPRAPLSFAWDIDGDGQQDTPFLADERHRFRIERPGRHRIGVYARYADGRSSEPRWAETTVAVQIAPNIRLIPERPVAGQEIALDASASRALAEPGESELVFRWDWHGDGVWDTGYSREPRWAHRAEQPGNLLVILEVRAKTVDGVTSTAQARARVEIRAPRDAPALVQDLLTRLAEAFAAEDQELPADDLDPESREFLLQIFAAADRIHLRVAEAETRFSAAGDQATVSVDVDFEQATSREKRTMSLEITLGQGPGIEDWRLRRICLD